jgi:zinc protease
MTINRKKAPAYKEITSLHYTRASKTLLTNGIPVFAIKGGDRDVVKCDFIFDAGVWYQPARLVASTTNALLLEGTISMNSQAVAEKIDFHGAHITVNTDFHFASVSLVCLHKHLPSMLELLKEIIFFPAFSENELENYLKKKKQALVLELDKVNTIARRKFLSETFGENHPYGQQVIAEDYDNITSGQLSAFHKSHYNKGNCSVVLAGKVDNKVLKLLDNIFGGSDFFGTRPVNSEIKIQHVNPVGRIIIPKDDVLQSAIRVGKRCVNKNHPDFQGL